MNNELKNRRINLAKIGLSEGTGMNVLDCFCKNKLIDSCGLSRFLEVMIPYKDGVYKVDESVFYNKPTREIIDLECGEVYTIYKRCIRCFGVFQKKYTFYCDFHNRYEISDRPPIEIGTSYYCQYSEGEVFEYCSKCGEPTLIRNLFSLSDKLCSNCADTIKIHRYHSFKDLKFLGNPSDNVFYGMEIETSYDKGDEMDFRKIIPKNDIVDNLSHYEEDCSITGVECITQPMSYEFMSNNIHYILNHLKDNGFYIEEDNGIHIHITRTEKTEKLLPKVLYFLEKNKDNVIIFSGRESYELTRWANFYSYDDEISLNDLSVCLDIAKEEDDRYRIVNNTNKNTIEFRLFRSSLNLKLVLGSLEFIAILFELAEKNQIDVSISFKNLVEYAKENNYSNFVYRCAYYGA